MIHRHDTSALDSPPQSIADIADIADMDMDQENLDDLFNVLPEAPAPFKVRQFRLFTCGPVAYRYSVAHPGDMEQVQFKSRIGNKHFESVKTFAASELDTKLTEYASVPPEQQYVVLSSCNPGDKNVNAKTKKWTVDGYRPDQPLSCFVVDISNADEVQYVPRRPGVIPGDPPFFAWIPGQCVPPCLENRMEWDVRFHVPATYGGGPTKGVKRPQEELYEQQHNKRRLPDKTDDIPERSHGSRTDDPGARLLPAVDVGGPAVEVNSSPASVGAGDTQRHRNQRAAHEEEALRRLQAEVQDLKAMYAAQGVAVKESAVFPPFCGNTRSLDQLMTGNDSGNSSGGSANSSDSGDILLTIDTTGEDAGNGPWHKTVVQKKDFINAKLATLFELSLHQNSDTAPEITVAETRDPHDNPVFEVKLDCEMEFPDDAKIREKANRLIEKVKRFLLHGIDDKDHHYIIMWNGREGSVILMLSAPPRSCSMQP